MFKLFTEKLVVQGEKKRKILGWAGLMKEENMPKEYLEGTPRFLQDRHGSIVIDADVTAPNGKRYNWGIFRKDQIVDEEWFQFNLQLMKEAGDRLHQLRQKEQKLKETWKGDETFVI